MPRIFLALLVIDVLIPLLLMSNSFLYFSHFINRCFKKSNVTVSSRIKSSKLPCTTSDRREKKKSKQASDSLAIGTRFVFVPVNVAKAKSKFENLLVVDFFQAALFNC